MVSWAELGKYPMIIDINKKILYLQDKDDNSIVTLRISIELYNSGLLKFNEDVWTFQLIWFLLQFTRS